jgi:tripartite-type tricarboxylate transporter receptor subunit TctC
MRTILFRFMKGVIYSAFVLLSLASGGVRADEYPSHPIKLIVPFAAGGPSDVTARTLAEALSRRLGQPLVVENFGGAGGNVGALRAAQSAPDGYTLMFTNISMAISPALYPDLAYDPVKDFVSMGIAVFQPTMLVARPSFAAVPFGGFVEYLKSNGEKVAAANTGPGGPSFLCTSLLMQQLHTRFNLIPYQGPASGDQQMGAARKGAAQVRPTSEGNKRTRKSGKARIDDRARASLRCCRFLVAGAVHRGFAVRFLLGNNGRRGDSGGR